jgi:mannose-6-phosphate isomerase-like protein (cupin superfamily)
MAHTTTNLREVENQAPKFDMPKEMQARFARSAIDGETFGLRLFTLEPNFPIPFGHKHENQEEVYVIVRGSARVKVDDEVVELGQWDAIRFDKDTMRNVEAGPDGVEYIAFGAGHSRRGLVWPMPRPVWVIVLQSNFYARRARFHPDRVRSSGQRRPPVVDLVAERVPRLRKSAQDVRLPGRRSPDAATPLAPA